jgi:hypothetical protein
MPLESSDLGEADAYLKDVLRPFGDLADEHINRHSIAWNSSQQRYTMLCDPEIVRAFRNPWHYRLDLWKTRTHFTHRIDMLDTAGEI